MLARLLMIAALLVPSMVDATVFFDDESETGSVFGGNSHLTGVLIPQGFWAIDTNVKFSGTGSLRLSFPASCQAGAGPNQCGGAISRLFTPTANMYRRWMFRMTGASQPCLGCPGDVLAATSDGKFHTSVTAFTKIMKGQADTITINGNAKFSRQWWMMGQLGGRTFVQSQENVPTTGSTTNFFTSKVLTDNVWYCLETHDQMNTFSPLGSPVIADGIAEAWVDGVPVGRRTNVVWRQPGYNNLWQEMGPIRQDGEGTMWIDRQAAGDTRIGCPGNVNPLDTTDPTPPTNLVAQ